MCFVQPVQEIETPSEDLTSAIAAGCRIVVLHGSIVAGLTSGHAASGASHYSWLSGR